MLSVDILDAFQALEAIAGTREERSGFEEIGEPAGNGRCLEGMVVGEELRDDVNAVGGDVSSCD